MCIRDSAYTSTEMVARQLSIIYGVDASIMNEMTSTDQMLSDMEHTLVTTGRAKPGDNIVFVFGQPVGTRGTTNMLKLHRVGSIG